MTHDAPSSIRPLREVLRNAAAEIARLQAVVVTIERALDDGATYGSSKDRAALQNLDLLTQTLETVDLFLDQVCEDVPPNVRVDIGAALACVHLEDVRGRLARCTITGTSARAPSGSDRAAEQTHGGLPEMF